MTLSASLVAFVNAALALVTNFGVNLSDNQKGSIVVLVNAGAVLGALLFDKITKRKLTGAAPGSAKNGP